MQIHDTLNDIHKEMSDVERKLNDIMLNKSFKHQKTSGSISELLNKLAALTLDLERIITEEAEPSLGYQVRGVSPDTKPNIPTPGVVLINSSETSVPWDGKVAGAAIHPDEFGGSDPEPKSVLVSAGDALSITSTGMTHHKISHSVNIGG